MIVWIDPFKMHSEFKLLKQMLDGHEKALEVSASLPENSPSKQKTLDQFIRRPENMDSPSKQKTLDEFVKRCDNMDRLEHEPNLKRPRN